MIKKEWHWMSDLKQTNKITMDKKPTIYCGGGKKMNDNWMTVTVHIDKVKEHVFDYKGNKYLKLNVNLKDQPDQYGKDVSLSVNTYNPEEQKETKPVAEVSNSSDDLPF